MQAWLRWVLLVAAWSAGSLAAHAKGEQSGQQQTGSWEVIHQQTTGAAGHASHPGIRYGHTCEFYQGQLITSHGYYYDRQKSLAQWHSDTWSMSMQPPYQWQQLHAGINQETSMAAYNQGQVPVIPCGRFGHASAMLNHTLYMYGGVDGGYSRHGRQNFESGYEFDELWAFAVQTRQWTHIKPASDKSPGRRHLAAMTGLQNQLFLYGGTADRQGDVWAFNSTSHQWRLLAPEPEPILSPSHSRAPLTPHPGRRMGHTLTPISSTSSDTYGFLLFGGRAIGTDGQSYLPQDIWYFEVTTASWRKVATQPNTPSPPPRLYHAAAYTLIPVTPATSKPDAAQATAGTRATKRIRAARKIPSTAADPAAPGAAGIGSGSYHKIPSTAADLTASGASDIGSGLQHSNGGSAAVQVGFIVGGTTSTPKLACASDAWAFVVDCEVKSLRWLQMPSIPVALYDTRAAADSQGLFVFGGHMCAQTEGYPFFYTNEVVRLQLSPLVHELLGHGCPMSAAQLQAEAQAYTATQPQTDQQLQTEQQLQAEQQHLQQVQTEAQSRDDKHAEL